MSFIKRLAGDTAWYGMSSIVSRVIMFFILAPYLTEILQSSEYGIHGIMYAFAALLLTFYTFRLETAFFRYGSDHKDIEASFWTASLFILGLGIFFTALLLSYSSGIAAILTKAADSRFVRYFAFIIFLDALAAIPFARLRLEHRPRKFALLKILNIVVTVITMLFLLEGLRRLPSNGFPALGHIYNPDHKLDYIFIANLCGSSITLLCLLPMYFRSKIQWSTALFHKLIRYSAPLLIVGVAGTVNQLTDRFFVKEWMPGNLTEKASISDAGIYTAAARIAVIINLFTQAYNYAAEPFFFKNKASGGSIKVYARSAEAFMLVGTCGFLFLSLNLHTIKYLIDEHYWSGLFVTPILMIAYLLLGLYYNVAIWYKLTDKTRYGAIISIVGAIITVGLNYLLIPRIGMTGAAVTSVSVYFTMVILAVLIGRAYYPIPYRFQRILVYPLLAVIMYYAYTYFIKNPYDFTMSNLIISNCVGLLFLGIIYIAERKFIARLIRKKYSS